MSYTPNAGQEYLKNAVLTATPEQLQLMLYDGAIRFASRGVEAMKAGDREGAFNGLERAQKIVLELNNGLNPEVNREIAEQMASLYSFIYLRLVEGTLRQDPELIEEALRILRYQRETWILVMEKLNEERGAGPGAPAPQAPTSDSTKPRGKLPVAAQITPSKPIEDDPTAGGGFSVEG